MPKEPKSVERTHKWWHFIYGKEIKSETVFKGKNSETRNCWEECKECGKQLGEKWGSTSFTITAIINRK